MRTTTFHTTIFSLAMLLLLSACKQDARTNRQESASTQQQEDDDINTHPIVGEWQGIEWSLGGEVDPVWDATKVNFEFMYDGKFKANFGDQHRAGKWRIDKDTLYTLEPRRKEFPMKLRQLDDLNLEIEMNLNGVPEVLKFKRK